MDKASFKLYKLIVEDTDLTQAEKKEILSPIRDKYWQIFTQKEKEYREAKEDYKQISDILYEVEQQWTRIN